MKKKQLPHKVVACFDIETTNLTSNEAFPVTWQLSILKDWNVNLNTFTNVNVKDNITISIDRYAETCYNRFDELILRGNQESVIPVIMIHNLGFEMYALAPYLNEHECKCVCKSCVKPLSISILDASGETVLVFWDTYSFFMKRLSILGDECNYPKLVGEWNYNLIRTPETPLTENEIAYATEDVCVLWAYLGYYLRLNDELDETELARKLLTKTSVVRYKSLKRVGEKKLGDKTVKDYWYRKNLIEKPKTELEMNLMHLSTRGGFTYCAHNFAGKILHKDKRNILKYDANSMHPFHATSHWVPEKYIECSPDWLLKCFDYIQHVSIIHVLNHYAEPMHVAFYGIFSFKNLRLKKGSIFERDGISTLAYSRFKTVDYDEYNTNEGQKDYLQYLYNKGLSDKVSDNNTHCFGKLEAAENCTLILNELSAWEVCQQFEWDSIECNEKGYWTSKFSKPLDKALLSINNFYRAKSVFKKLKVKYERGEELKESDFPLTVPEYLKQGMIKHDENLENDVETYYLTVKSDLNALYGIEATNEAKNKILINENGFYVDEYKGLDNLPKKPKTWYQYGMHIVGWSRIHQLLFMLLLSDTDTRFVCGDTDSHKLWTTLTPEQVALKLKPLHKASKDAHECVTKHAKEYGEWYPMNGLGFYELEGEPDAFCASWNKSYMELNSNTISITLAGIPTTTGDHSYKKLANRLYKDGYTFDSIASLLIGYNVIIDPSITGLNGRHVPIWGDFINQEVTDYYGNTTNVNAVSCLHISEMSKIIGNTDDKENAINCTYAKKNNPNINNKLVEILWISYMPEVFYV